MEFPKFNKKADSLWVIFLLFSLFLSTFGDFILLNNIKFYTDFLDYIAQHIPSISVIEKYSEYPTLSRRFFAMLWILQPLIIIFYIKNSDYIGLKKTSLSRKPIKYLILVSMVLIVVFVFNFYLIGSEYLLSVPRDNVDSELVLMGKLINQINYNRITLGILGGGFLMLFGYMTTLFIISVKNLRNTE